MTNTTPLRMLVVADQADTRSTVCWMIERAYDPVNLVQAGSAKEAAAGCSGELIDCILIDAATSEFETTLRTLLEAISPALVPVVVLLGKGDDAARTVAQELGVIDWLRKDQFSPAILGLTVRRAIDVASLRLMLAEQGRELERLRESEAAAKQQIFAAGSVRSAEHYQAPMPTSESQHVPADVEAEQGAGAVAARAGSTATRSGELLVAPKLVTSGVGGQNVEDEELAQRVQKDLMPPGAPYLDGFDVAGLSIPAAATGGDYYDYLPVGDDLLSITIGECSGQGLGPAMMMASMRAYLRVLAVNSMDLSEVVSRANTYMTEDVGDEEFLVTLMLVQIDQLTKSLRYCSAGHQGHLLKRDGEVEVLPSTGMPMGLQPETVIPEAEQIRLRTGDAVLLTTDGLQKMVSPTGERFGTARMLDLIKEHRELPARMIIEYLRKACGDFGDPDGQSDDITIVLVKCDPADPFQTPT